jgi:threonyl-tRNA synthetase
MLVVGDKEQAAGAVAVRLRSGEDLGALPVANFLDHIQAMVAERRI